MPSEIIDMDQAIRRLSVPEREAQHEADDRRAAQPAEDPYEGYDEDERLMLGVSAEEDTVTIEIDGKPAKVARSQLAGLIPQPQPQIQSQPQPQPADTRELDGLITRLRSQVQDPVLPNDTLADEDPEAYSRAVAGYNRQVIANQKAEADLVRAEEQRQSQASLQHQQNIQGQQQALAGQWPEWGDPKTHTKVASQLRAYALKDNQYSPQEAEMIANGQVDHRLVLNMRAAMRAELLAKPRKRRRRNETPPVGSPGVRQSESRKQSKRRDEFLQKADREGVSIAGATDFLAGKHST